jgi:hypothetical protein
MRGNRQVRPPPVILSEVDLRKAQGNAVERSLDSILTTNAAGSSHDIPDFSVRTPCILEGTASSQAILRLRKLSSQSEDNPFRSG